MHSGFLTSAELFLFDVLILYLTSLGQMSYVRVLKVIRYGTVADMALISRLNQFAILDRRDSIRVEDIEAYDRAVADAGAQLIVLRHLIDDQKFWNDAAAELTDAESYFRESVTVTWKMEVTEEMRREIDRRRAERGIAGVTLQAPEVVETTRVDHTNPEDSDDENVRTSHPLVANI